ncbi:MAG: uroporphyrinogen decarboxylase family protein [Anaerolineae bacterium]
MPETMTPKERILTVMRHGIPDRVPAFPGIGPWFGTRLLGLTMWDVSLSNDPDVAPALMLDIANRLDYDDWFLVAPGLDGGRRDGLEPVWRERVVSRDAERVVKHCCVHTDRGDLERVVVYPRNDPQWEIEKPIKDIARDWPRVRALLGEDWVWKAQLSPWYEKLGSRGIYPLGVNLFVDWWYSWRHGTIEQLIYDLTDHREELREIREYHWNYSMAYLDAAIQARPDEIFIQGSSSSMSVISPNLYREYNLPFVQEVTRRCKAAGIPTHEHTCGRSRAIVEMHALETDLDVMEPLERQPGGDVDLAEIKQRFGHKLCLKGNVNTFDTMLRGTPAEVAAEVRGCLEVAAPGGGFWLSTGDQTPREAPEDNVRALIETTKAYGRYG